MRPYNSNYFFRHINLTYGSETVTFLKSWINVNKKIILCIAHILFLKQCRSNGLLPSHLSSFFNHDIEFHHQRSFNKHSRIKAWVLHRTLCNEIADSHDHLRHLKYVRSHIMYKITGLLPRYLCIEFYRSHHCMLSRFEHRENCRLFKKFHWLLYDRNLRSRMTAVPVEYFCYRLTSNSNNQFSLTSDLE